jgi:site-specific DNA-methyltransferase (adenine-specific)
MNNLRLKNQDCKSFLKDISSNSVDLIIVDPPYFQISKEPWDNQWSDEHAYLHWCQTWVKYCSAILKPGGCFYIWGTTKTNTFLRFKLDVLDSGLFNLHYKNWIIWSYDWGGRTKKTWPRKHEDLLMYTKGNYDPLFNTDAVRVPYKMKNNIRNTAQNHPLGKIPTDVWEQNNHTGSKEYVSWHPTQKPLALLERIVLANSREEDTILDCFSGSGSTAIAALRHNRKFIGCELSEEYYEKSLDRIRKLT